MKDKTRAGQGQVAFTQMIDGIFCHMMLTFKESCTEMAACFLARQSLKSTSVMMFCTLI
jgi:hypothetical protein